MAAKFKLDWAGKKRSFLEAFSGKVVLVSNCGKNDVGDPFLTHNCASIKEFEANINSLKDQLDKILCSAKKKLLE
jgi:hypothetical protein